MRFHERLTTRSTFVNARRTIPLGAPAWLGLSSFIAFTHAWLIKIYYFSAVTYCLLTDYEKCPKSPKDFVFVKKIRLLSLLLQSVVSFKYCYECRHQRK